MPETMEFAIFETKLFIRAPQRFCGPEAGNLLDEINTILDRSHCQHLFVDLSACHYLDSTVLGQLVALHRRLGPGGLILAKPSPDSRQILLIMGLDKLLTITEDVLPNQLSFQALVPERKNSAEDVLQAHLLLSQLSPDNTRRFETLIKTLNQSIDAHKK